MSTYRVDQPGCEPEFFTTEVFARARELTLLREGAKWVIWWFDAESGMEAG